ncbi:tRNA (N(6)-L-threonylcarbamoyladenosine(37)-C(2))-methylthiotransferase MtaB [Oricola sp.]|uniref:tRNA (N(6)-L-threonylcarbamoyladenosine(37)-C(2))- methylthiotransferase MtaB n=1 Tax=Oricola sp. TaxID=1979950 RepID=UPI003BA92A90
MGIDIVTFGCRLNTYESEVMRGEAEAAGLGELDGGAIVFNTCAVTGEAVRQARQAIRRARRENPDARIIVTGCAAQTEPASFGEMDEVDLVIGNDDKLKAQSYRALPEFGVNQFEKVRVNDIFEVRETAAHMVDAIEGRARAFVQVQNGCDHRCTFCIIPYGRGNSRSVPMGAVVEQVKRLVENGYREVVLTGVDLTSYGPDLPGQPSLGKLVLSILRQVPELDRLRLSSIDSIEADDALMEAIATEARLMPHFHLSLQHGDNLILKRMKRRHAREDSIRFCEDVRRLRPDAAFGADIIAGFPTESEEHFANSLSIVDECGLAHVHAFPFSPRDGTPAARMPQLPRDVVKDRARRLRAKANEAWLRHMEQLSGTRQDVLVERENIGRIADFSVVALDGVETAPGSLVPAVITGHDGEMLRGTPALAQAAE